MICAKCLGSGAIKSSDPEELGGWECPDCYGTGHIDPSWEEEND